MGSLRSEYPEYLLDRTLIINEDHKEKILVNGFKLAVASEYFKSKIKTLYRKELKKENTKTNTSEPSTSKRCRKKSISEIEKDPLIVHYDDVKALKFLINYAHQPANAELNDKILLSVLNAAIHFNSENLIQFIFDYAKKNINISNCWLYWEIASKQLVNLKFSNLLDLSQNYIHEHFLRSVDNAIFLNLSIEDFTTFLKNDELNIANEMSLLPVMNKWIEQDITNRLHHCPLILSCIRLGKFQLKHIKELISNIYIQSTWEACIELINCSNMTFEDILINPQLPHNQHNDLNELITYTQSSRLPREVLFVLGGWETNNEDEHSGPSKAIQIYDPRSSKWHRHLSNPLALDVGHSYAACITYNNCIYLIGGYVNYGPVQTLKMFDFARNEWKFLSPMHEQRNYVIGCQLDGYIYAIGGHNGDTRLCSVEQYNMSRNSWNFIAPMHLVRSDGDAAGLGGKIYVCGGFDGSTFFCSVEAYDPSTDQWTFVSSMLNVRSGVSVLTLKNRLYAIGGNDGLHRLSSMEMYNPEFNRWSSVKSMSIRRSNFCATVLENVIYVIGGWCDEFNSTVSIVERIDPSNPDNDWEITNSLPFPASANCCCTITGLQNIKEHLQN